MATASISLASSIYSQALAQNVPPAIALAVAQQESGISQWTPSGNLVTGTSGEVGVFQLMPATAAGLGVDPTDVDQNISGGISLLAQLYEKYGNWSRGALGLQLRIAHGVAQLCNERAEYCEYLRLHRFTERDDFRRRQHRRCHAVGRAGRPERAAYWRGAGGCASDLVAGVKPFGWSAQ